MLASCSHFGRFALPVAALALSVFALVAAVPNAHAQQTLAQNNSDSIAFTASAVGQSVTVGGSGAFNSLVFNFYSAGSSSGVLGNPLALGTVYLLTQAYAGTPAALSSSTPGFLASAAGNNNLYTFASAVTVQGGTQYFFYENTLGQFAVNISDTYSGGIAYSVNSTTSNFSPNANFDLGFRLQGAAAGAAAPEPGTLPLVGMGLAGGLGMVKVARRKQGKAGRAA